jgi:branched-subunit amino acid ABC-type transport system permease component
MGVFLASLVDGLMLGFVYGLAAMGLSLIWGVMQVINLAHGPFIALGMFSVYYLGVKAGLTPYGALIFALFFGLLAGIITYFVAVHRVLDAPHLTTLLATFSVNLMIIGLGTVIFTTTPRAVDIKLPSVSLGAVSIPATRFVAAFFALLSATGLYLFLYGTKLGKSVRAVAMNRAAAELMGINTVQVLAFSFGLGTMLAMIAGGLIATLFPFTILSGSVYELKSFVICVLGGLGNPAGALVGGIILGLLEGGTSAFIPVSWVPVIEFALLVLILLVRPKGLLGG